MRNNTHFIRIITSLLFVSALVIIPASVHAASPYIFGPFGFTGKITSEYKYDSDDPADIHHTADSVVLNVAEDGSGTVTKTIHDTETSTFDYVCTGVKMTVTTTTDGSVTATIPAGTVKVNPTWASTTSGLYDEYSINFILTSDVKGASITETTTFTGSNSNCSIPDNSTETSTADRWVLFQNYTTAKLTDPNVAHFSSTATYVNEDGSQSTITVENLDGCGEELGKNWVDRFPVPYLDNKGNIIEKKAIEALSKTFRPNVQNFIVALRKAKAKVTVGETTRPQARAYLMAKSLILAGGADPEKMVRYPGTDAKGKAVASDGAKVPICWSARNATTGAVDKEKTKTLAAEMAKAYNIHGASAYPTEHMKGNAADLTIEWPRTMKTLQILQGPKLPKGTPRATVKIKNGVHSGINPALWRIGESYGVIKGPGGTIGGKDARIADDVHWSLKGN